LINFVNEEFTKQDADKIFEIVSTLFDKINGGTKGTPKFPMPNLFLLLLRYYHINKNDDLLKYINLTLRKMAFGGIYDQIGGGFARYSTDEIWKVPHFEKMLYDNAQLVTLYSEAYQLTQDKLYKDIVYETLGFIERELTSKEGTFYSSLDADSEGIEGKFYVWKKNEIQDILKDDASLFCDYFEVDNEGSWENGSILLRNQDIESFAKKNNIETNKLKEIIKNGKEKLLLERNKRIKPGLDDKLLTSWNALMIKAYADASAVFSDSSMLEKAIQGAEFILKHMSSNEEGLSHVLNSDKSAPEGMLEDYCFFIEALISLYQATLDIKWLQEADNLMKYVLEHFYDSSSGMFYINEGKDQNLIKRPRDVIDNVIPSSNSSIARSLLRLGLYFDKDDYKEKSKKMLKNLYESLMKYPATFSNWVILLLETTYTQYIVTILGKDVHEKRKDLNQHYEPFKIFAGGLKEDILPHTQQRLIEGETMIYVCTEKDCRKPTTEIEEALKQLVVV